MYALFTEILSPEAVAAGILWLIPISVILAIIGKKYGERVGEKIVDKFGDEEE
jgi:hypothetical protein